MGEREDERVEGESGVIYSRRCWKYQWFAHFTDIVVFSGFPVGGLVGSVGFSVPPIQSPLLYAHLIVSMEKE